MSRSRPEKRNGRKGLEIEFKIECKVEEQKSTQKSHSKLTFFKRNGSFKCRNQPHMLCFNPKQCCAKEWPKKKRNSLSYLVFWCKKWPSKKSKKTTIKHTFRPQKGLLLPSNQPKMWPSASSEAHKQKEKRKNRFQVSCCCCNEKQANISQKTTIKCYLLPW